MSYKIKENKTTKVFVSPEYNYVFNKENGNMMSWGKTPDDDPDICPYGPVIADIEVTTICHGTGTPCSFCYKSNTGKGHNMSLAMFKDIFKLLPRTLTQIAFGIGDIDANPDLFDIFKHCNENGVKPNLTINGSRMTDKLYNKLVKQCGAIAVSHYGNNVCFDAVNELTKRGLKQTNIHKMLSNETFDSCIDLLWKTKTDDRLQKLNAIVFLLMKPKGDRNYYTCLRDKKKYGQLISLALNNHIPIGFDSCSAPYFVEWAKANSKEELINLAEPCESMGGSIYISCDGRAIPCSFCDSKDKPGIDLLSINSTEDFVKNVWNSKMSEDFRNDKKNKIDKNGCAHCPKFDLDME